MNTFKSTEIIFKYTTRYDKIELELPIWFNEFYNEMFDVIEQDDNRRYSILYYSTYHNRVGVTSFYEDNSHKEIYYKDKKKV